MPKYFWKIISLILVVSGNTFFSSAQEKNEREKILHGFYVDFDLMDPLFSALDPDRFGMNASVEISLFHGVFPVFEIGYARYEAASDYSYLSDVIKQPDNYSYKINGLYYKIGINFNLLKQKDPNKLAPIAYLGIRYAISPFKYDIENLLLQDLDWNESYSFNASGTTIGQWGEVLLGVKTPIYKNFCLGVDVRFKQFLYIQQKRTENKIVNQSYAPGFGDRENDKWSFRYTISYFFPL